MSNLIKGDLKIQTIQCSAITLSNVNGILSGIPQIAFRLCENTYQTIWLRLLQFACVHSHKSLLGETTVWVLELIL